MQIERVGVIINPASGSAQPVLRILNAVFRERDIAWDVRITQETGDGAKYAREIYEDVDVIMVCGGDGTVNDVVNGLINSATPLMVLPCGTGNSIAEAFQVPKNLSAAVSQTFERTPQAVDLGYVSGLDQYFMLRVGMSAAIDNLKDTSPENKSRLGVLAYGITGIQAAFTAQKTRYLLTLDERHVEIDGIACVIANLDVLGILGLTVREEIRLNDGVLDVIVLRDVVEGLAGIAGDIVRSQEGAGKYLPHWQGHKVHVETEPPQNIHVDGDRQEHQTPLTLQCVRGAVRIMGL